MVKDTVVRVGVRELRGNLSGYLQQAQRGTSFLVVSHGKVVAELRPPIDSTARPARQPGLMRGEIWMADDFDRTPDDLIDIMEGRTPG